MGTPVLLAEFGRTAQRLVEILALATRPELEDDQAHQSVALHLLELEMTILKRRWDGLAAVRRRLDIDGRR